MRVGLLTREYPPDVYGGAGVHVEYLARELATLVDLDVHCWGEDRPGAHAHRPWEALSGRAPHLAALQAVSGDLAMAGGVGGVAPAPRPTGDGNPGGPPASATP